MISVIMPTYNKAEYLDYTLASFVNQSSKDFELVIVNDGSRDNTEEIVNKYAFDLNIQYHSQQNKGRSAARNRGIQKSKGEILFFNDDDRIAEPNLVKNITSLFEKNTVIIGWKGAIVTMWIKDKIPARNDTLFSISEYMYKHKRPLEDKFKIFEAEDLKDDFNVIFSIPQSEGPDNFTEVVEQFGENLRGFHFPWILGTTANMVVEKSLVESVGGFDEGFQGWGVEDTDFSYRLYKKKTPFKFCRQLKNYHQSHPYNENGSFFRQIAERDRELVRNHQYFCRKHQSLDTAILFKGFREKKSIVEINELYNQIINLPNVSIRAEITDLYQKFVESWKI